MKKKLLSILCAMCCMMFFISGCGGGDDSTSQSQSTPAEQSSVADSETSDSETNDAEEVSLSDWEGTWNSIDAYADEEELGDAFAEAGEKEGKSKEEAIADFKEKRKCEFKGVIFKGNKITFLDNFEDKGGKEVSSDEYEFVKSHETEHDGGSAQWHEFKAKSPDAKYPVLLLMPVHGEEEVVHFHLRYGDDGEALLAQDDWYPTLIKPSTTMDQLKAEVGE